MTDPLPERALSIRQPWAWAICHAGKDIENRSWPTKFRGPVCIHAGVRADGGIPYAMINQIQTHAIQRGISACDIPAAQHLGYGGIVGVAEIVDCVDTSNSPWFFGPYGFVLANARPVPFIPCRGALGFFRWRP